MEKIRKINFKLKRFLSEYLDREKIPSRPFKILLGGKNRGKSYLAFEAPNGVFDTLRKGGKVCYLRNTEQEAIMQKAFFLNKLSEMFPEIQFQGSKTGITVKSTKREVVTFLSAKNYNKISGNQDPYSCVFYDEFNQNLDERTIRLLYQLPMILNTLFRTHDLNVGICGNTLTSSSPIYDLFNLEQIPANTTYTDENLGMMRFDDSLFTEEATSSLSFFKSQQSFESLFLGNEYDKENGLIQKNIPENELQFLGKSYVLNTMKYGLFTTREGIYYLKKIPSLKIAGNRLTYTDDKEETGLNGGNYFPSYQNGLLAKRINSQKIFFEDYNAYLSFVSILDRYEDDFATSILKNKN